MPSGFEPENKGFADLRLTTWLWHRVWSGRRDSNSRHPPWQGGTLPLSYYRTHGALGRNRTTDTQIFSLLLYRLSYQGTMATRKGLEPSTSSVTGWHSNQLNYRATIGGNNRARTCDPLLVRQMLSQLSYAPQRTGRTTAATGIIITPKPSFVNIEIEKKGKKFGRRQRIPP